MNSIISTFHIDWKIIVAQAINFAVVFVVLYIFALKPLNKLMAERTEKIKKGVDDAKKNSEMLKATRVEYEQILAKARIEASKFSQESKKEQEARKAAMIEEAKKEMKAIIENGKKSLETEKVKTVEEAKKDIVMLAMKEVEKILSSKKDLNNL